MAHQNDGDDQPQLVPMIPSNSSTVMPSALWAEISLCGTRSSAAWPAIPAIAADSGFLNMVPTAAFRQVWGTSIKAGVSLLKPVLLAFADNSQPSGGKNQPGYAGSRYLQRFFTFAKYQGFPLEYSKTMSTTIIMAF